MTISHECVSNIKKVRNLIIILIFPLFAQAQQIRVINKITGFSIPGVVAYNDSRTTSVMSDGAGFLELNKFSDKDSINFYHISFHDVFYTKKQIKDAGFIVELVPDDYLIDIINITSSNDRENANELPYIPDIIYKKDLDNLSAGTSAEILGSTGNVMIQKSQAGGGSPIIRGFEANRVLIVLDGVRMNNAIYRGGHLQNSITIDNSILEKVDIIYGSASVLYGSDALGGVLHYKTLKPRCAADNKFPVFRINSYEKITSVNSSYSHHTDFNIGYNKFASLSSITYNNFGDIKIGKNRVFSGDDKLWGLDSYYVSQIRGADTTLQNNKPTTLLNTGYKQYDFVQKFRFKPSRSLDFNFNLQYSTSSNINRYDKLSEFKNDNLKYAEWYYGPQNRLFASGSLFYEPAKCKFFTNMKTIFAYQNIEESRNSRKFSKEEIFSQTEKLNIFSLNIDFLKLIKISRLSYGLEIGYNDVNSSAFYKNIFENKVTAGETRYPDGGSSILFAGIYGNYKYLLNERNIITTGIRYSSTKLNSKFSNRDGFVQLPFNEINMNNGAFTGTLSYIALPFKNWKFRATVSSGFRSPNVDDYGKIRAKDNLVTVPNDKLKPEYAYNFEIGITRTLLEYMRVNITGFNTLLQNAIVRTDYSLNGNDSLEFDGDMYRIVTNNNVGTAYLRGISLTFEGDFDWDLLKSNFPGDFKFRNTFNFIQGQDISNDVPLAHIPPFFGISGFTYKIKKYTFASNLTYNGLKKTENMSPFGEDNQEAGLSIGFPAWFTGNFSIMYKFTENLSLRVAVDNIADIHYRSFASGISAPGRSFIFTFRMKIN